MGREGEQAMVGRGLLEDPGRRDLEFGLDGAPDPLRAVPELGPWVVAHHATRYRRIAAIPPNARKRSWPSSESFEMSSTAAPIPREAAVLFADLRHLPLDEGLLPHQVQAAQDLPPLLDEFPKAVLVRVARVEERGEDSFLEFVMEKVSRRELFLRVTRPADDDPLEVRKVQERFRHQIPDFLVPLVDRDIVAPFEAARTLASHPVLGRHLRLEILDHLDPLAAQ